MGRKQKQNKFLNAVLVYILIASSGIPFFYIGSASNLYFPLIFSAAAFFFKISQNGFFIDFKFSKFWRYCIIVLIVITFQITFTGIVPLILMTGFFKRFLIAFFVLYVVRENFFERYVRVIYVIGIISFLVHASTFLSPNVLNFYVNSIVPHIPNQPDNPFHFNYQIIIHCFWQRDFLRNSGPFWEPGANAGFTIIALVFNLFLFKQSLFSKKNIVFFIIILSTISTAGYFTVLLLVIFNATKNSSVIFRMIFITVLTFIFVLAVQNLDVLGLKIVDQYENIASGNAHTSRFASAELDFETFSKYPLSGYSTIDLRNGDLGDDDFRTNGIFILLATYGGIFFMFYFLSIYGGFRDFYRHLNNSNQKGGALISVFFVLILLSIGFSENYFIRPLFIGFSMLPMFIPRVKKALARQNRPPVAMRQPVNAI
ncbi:hypothetical protein ACFJIV_01275 [Mucilaginibacter sp. UC70_90]